MKETSPIVAALDIGTTKVCAVIARKNNDGKIEILGVGKADSLGVMRGVISNIDKTVNAIKEAVAEAQHQAGITVRKVYIGIAGQHIRSEQDRGYVMRNNAEAEITQQDIDKLIADMHKKHMPPGEKIIHVLPQEYTIDDESGIKEPLGMSGAKLESDFHVITGQVAAIKNIHRCVEKAQLEVADLMLEPIASASAVLSQEERVAGVALVDIGGGTTDLAIFHEGIIRHTAVIPLGGNIITEDIREGCLVMRDQAEKLKVKFGSAIASEAQDNAVVAIPGLRGRPAKEISLKNLANIIQARMEEILEYVNYEIRHSGFENKLIAGIVITGGGGRMRYLQHLAEYIAGYYTRIGIPTEHLELSVNEDRELADPLYATSIGLAITALNNEAPIATEPYMTPEVEEPVSFSQYETSTTPAFETVNADKQTVGAKATATSTATQEEKTNTPTGGSWWENGLRKMREWLEGDVQEFRQ